MKSITQFITQKLKLKVNESKSAVAKPQERKFLGFSFTDGPEVKRVIAPKALDRFKRESAKSRVGPRVSALKRPWRNWPRICGVGAATLGFCETPRVLGSLTCRVRARLRAALWRQWKTPRRRRAALLAMGVRPTLAKNTACSSRGPWFIAHAKALSVALPTAYFQSLGLPHLADGH